MLKKISIFSLFIMYSCQNNLDISNIKNNDSKLVSSTNNNQNTELNNKNSILDINSFKYKTNFNNLKKLLKEDTKVKIRQVYIDNNNNLMIFLSDKIYLLNKELDITKTINLGEDKKYQFSKPILDNNGNGFIQYYPETGTGLEDIIIKKVENFIPTETKIFSIDYEKKLSLDDTSTKNNFRKYIAYINKENFNNYTGKSFSFYNDKKELLLSDITKFFDYKEINKFKLDTTEVFDSVITNKNNDALVITKEESNNNETYRYYQLKNNNLDLKKSNNIINYNSFGFGTTPIIGNLDTNGNGLLYFNSYQKSELNIFKINSFEVEKEPIVIKNINSISYYLNNEGNGIIISKDEKDIYFNKIEKFKIIGSVKLAKNPQNVTQVVESVNDNGYGILLVSNRIFDINNDSYSFNNEIFIISNNNIVL